MATTAKRIATGQRGGSKTTIEGRQIVKAKQPWRLNHSEITIVKNSIAKGASDEELKFCLTVARRYKLDPFKQQIWFVRRWDSNAENGKGGTGSYVWTPQVGINGLLFIAARDHKGEFGSVSVPEYGPMIKVGSIEAPEWAKVQIWKKGESIPTEAQAWWTEYAPADLSKAPFWRKMPRRMIGKCSISLGIKQAYPDLGGLYIPEEMQRMGEDFTPEGRQIIDVEPGAGTREAAKLIGEEKVKKLKEAATKKPKAEPIVAEPELLWPKREPGIEG